MLQSIRNTYSLGFHLPTRVKLVLVTIFYILVNVYSYIYYLNPVWDYQGFPVFNVAFGLGPLLFAAFSCVAFSLIFPFLIHSYSRFVVWFIFFFIYVPTVLVVAMQGYPADGGYALIGAVTLSLYLIAFVPEILLGRAGRIQLDSATASVRLTKFDYGASAAFLGSRFENVLMIIYFLTTGALLIFYSSVIAFVDLRDVYDQRELVSDFAPNKTIEAYLMQWFLRVVSPFMIAVGLLYNRRRLLLLGILGMLLGYLITGSKFIVFSIPLMYGVYLFVISNTDMQAVDMGKLFALVLAAVLVGIGIYGTEAEEIIGLVLSQIAKRAYAINGMTLGNYYDFFINASNDFTYYSHLGPVAWFVDYPYGQFGIGQIVGHFQADLYTYDMSAGFWATDGIAAAGYIGVIFIGFLLGCVLTAFNFFAIRMDFRLVCLASIGSIWMLADTSVFRAILSGGWPLHFILAYYYQAYVRIKG